MSSAPRYVRFTLACLVLGAAFALLLTLAFHGRPPTWVTVVAAVVVAGATMGADVYRQRRTAR